MTQNHVTTPGRNRQPMTDDRSTDERLTIADLARLLAPSPTRPERESMGRSLLQRYDANKDVQRLLGKDGGTYPASSLPWWEALAQARAQEPPLVRPETAGVFLASLMQGQATGDDDDQPPTDHRLPIIPFAPRPEAEALVVARQVGGDALTALQRLVGLVENAALTDDRLAIITGLTRALDRHSDLLAALPAGDDALLEAEEVRKVIPRGEAWLRRNVPSVKVGRARMWKRSAVMGYIASL